MHPNGHSFIIRSGFNRWLKQTDGSARKLRDVLATVEHLVERDAKLSKRRAERSTIKAKIHPAREPRVAKLCVATTRLTLVRPANYGRRGTKAHLGDLPRSPDMNVVRVWEPEPPAGTAPIEWILFTNEPVTTTAEALEVVDHYRARWTIEEYFKALKTGCSFERRQLQDYEALVNLLAVFAPIAYHVLLLRTQARSHPEASAQTLLTDDQLNVLRTLGRRPLPAAPTMRDALLCIAALGGHIAYAPDPGWLTLSRGYAELDSLTRAWVAAKLHSSSDQR